MGNIIGENIKILREKAGYNQMSIAKFLGVDQSLISKIEKGERNLSTDMLEKLACLFGVSIESLETGKVEEPTLSFAFRTSDMSIEDMESISAINRIALNSEYMARLLKGV